MDSNPNLTPAQEWPADLRSEHRDYLWQRGVEPEVARARGYRSVRGGEGHGGRNIDESYSKAYGFAIKDRPRPSGLLIPLHPLIGDQRYQLRVDDPEPDSPKFLTPGGDANVLSTSPLTRDSLGDKGADLCILEGITRVDAVAAYGIPAVGINGCWGWRSKDAALPDFESLPLRTRNVIVGFDADALTNPEVNRALNRLAAFLRGRGADKVFLLRVPTDDDDRTRGLDDWLAAERFETPQAVWQAIRANCTDTLDFDPDEAADSPGARYRSRDRNLPDVYAGTDDPRHQESLIRDAYKDGNQAAGADRVYNFHGDFAVVASTSTGVEIRELKPDAWRGIVQRYVNFWQWHQKQRILCSGPVRVINSMYQAGVSDEPPLHGLASFPYLSPDGLELVTESGYSEDSGIYLTDYPDILPMDVQQAVAEIDDVFADFPLETDHDRAGLYAMLLTPIVRRALPTAPFMLVTKPQPREGASLMTDLVSIIIGGGSFVSIAVSDKQSELDESLRKSIATAALDPAGRRLWRFDNMPATFSSPSFAEFLTDPGFSTRRLGTNDAVVMPPGGVSVYGTTNSIEVSQEVVARCYEVRINSGTPNPSMRSGFRHSDIRAYVSERRGRLLSAVITLVKAWLDAGRPTSARPMGMGGFERWAGMMASILGNAGIAGFMEQQTRLAARASIDTQDETAFVARWWDVHQGNEVSIPQLYALNGGDDDALLPVRGKDESGKRRSLGRTVAKFADRTFALDDGAWVRVRSRKVHNQAAYRLEQVVTECRMPDCNAAAGPSGFCADCE